MSEIANLPRVSDMLALAQRHEDLAVSLAQNFDAGSVEKAAHHFTIAQALRGRARFAR